MGESYSQSRTITLPPTMEGRFHVYVTTDAAEQVFENGHENNNTASASGTMDVARFSYADLVVTSLDAPTTAASGQPLTFSWSVENQGLAITDAATWPDYLRLATDPAGNGDDFVWPHRRDCQLPSSWSARTGTTLRSHRFGCAARRSRGNHLPRPHNGRPDRLSLRSV